MDILEFYQAVCLPYREAINGGLMALRRVIPGGDTFMNLGLEMVRLSLWVYQISKASPNYTSFSLCYLKQ